MHAYNVIRGCLRYASIGICKVVKYTQNIFINRQHCAFRFNTLLQAYANLVDCNGRFYKVRDNSCTRRFLIQFSIVR